MKEIVSPIIIESIKNRISHIAESLSNQDKEWLACHHHLDKETLPRAYWNHGYMMALKDILGLIEFKDPQ